MTLQQAVFAGLVDPGNLVAVREIVDQNGLPMGATPANLAALPADCPAPTADAVGRTVKIIPNVTKNCDTAAFLAETLTADPVTGTFDPLSQYTITQHTDGSVIVADNTSVAAGPPFPKGDGITNTLWNIENLRFCVSTDVVTKKCTAFFDFPLSTITPVAAPLIGVVTPPPGTLDLAFGSVATGTSAAPQSITVNNTGNAPLLVSGVTVTGTGASSFTATPAGSCASIPASGSCTVSVTFAPTSAGAKEATVGITSNTNNVSGSVSNVTVTGTGTAPVAGVAPNTLAFGSVNTGTTSTPQAITVSNTGNVPLVVTSIAVTGPNAALFTATPTGCATIAAGSNCTVNVAFAPTSAGAKTATVSITHNSNNVAGSVSNVTLTGTGVTVTPPPPPTAPRVSMPATFSFGAQRTNANRNDTVQITNQGPGALVISNVTTSGGVFTATRGNCPASLAAGRNCKLNVTFRPLLRQSYTGTLTLTSNASNNPTVTTLTGSGR